MKFREVQQLEKHEGTRVHVKAECQGQQITLVLSMTLEDKETGLNSTLNSRLLAIFREAPNLSKS